MKCFKALCFVILDGYGIYKKSPENAITAAHTPTITLFEKKFFCTTLAASGAAVGLPDGYIGNSEVGHITLGAGRIVLQPLSIINNAITDGSFFSHPVLDLIKKKIAGTNAAVHLIGLLSDAGVHAHIEHMTATLHALSLRSISRIFLHPILDGRDVAPRSAAHFLRILETFLFREGIGTLGTLHGRFYAMDRDNNWDRTERSYRILTEQQAMHPISWEMALEESYRNGISDEFFLPRQLRAEGCIRASDVVIFLNFRPDRARQLAMALDARQFSHFTRHVSIPELFVTPVDYEVIPDAKILYPQQPIRHTLKEELSKHNKSMFVIAETEKYAHVTYFLGGGTEKPFPHETRLLIPSLKLSSYDLSPEMQANAITQAILEHANRIDTDVYIVNYANADMVAHSGNFEATVVAIECLDAQLKRLYEFFVVKNGGILLVTGDHGNAEEMKEHGEPKTAHTKNRVPFFLISDEKFFPTRPLEGLADVAPLILHLLSLQIPQEMREEMKR